MNPRQITVLWLAITALAPSAYLVISRGVEVERAVSENRELREGSVDHKVPYRRYLVTFEREGKTVTYEVKSKQFPRSDEETEKLIANGRQLSDREAVGWQEKATIERYRRRYWEFSAIGFFTFCSLVSLLVFRAKNAKPPEKSVEPAPGSITPRASEGTSK
jgi:hypothetical protein